jgi:hypothetical protein
MTAESAGRRDHDGERAATGAWVSGIAIPIALRYPERHSRRGEARMIIVYRAANTADAHLIRQMLEAEGLPAFIQGEYLQGAVGELPANTEILVRVSDEHFDAARAVVADWESGEPMAFDDDDDDVAASAAAAPAAAQSAIRYFLLFVAIVVGGSIAMMVLQRYAEG